MSRFDRVNREWLVGQLTRFRSDEVFIWISEHGINISAATMPDGTSRPGPTGLIAAGHAKLRLVDTSVCEGTVPSPTQK